jgi:hypothetical protein
MSPRWPIQLKRHRRRMSPHWPIQLKRDRRRHPRRVGPPVNRERLAGQQAELVRALVGGGPVPGGFDPERVRATSAALARKRAREVARVWPVLAADLGEEFTGRFVADAARRPAPARGGALADGLAFARALARQGRLSPNARVEAMLAAATLSSRPARLGLALAGPPRRLVVTVRAPGLGERWMTVPLG